MTGYFSRPGSRFAAGIAVSLAALVALPLSAEATSTPTFLATGQADGLYGGGNDLTANGVDVIGGKVTYSAASQTISYVDAWSGSSAGPLLSNGSFTWEYDFTLSAPTTVAFRLNDSPPYGVTWNNSASVGGLYLTGVVTAVDVIFSTANLAAGSYQFIVSGVASSGTSAISGRVSAVPLPGAVVLFGSGLLALAVAGRRRLTADRSALAAAKGAGKLALLLAAGTALSVVAAARPAQATLVTDTVTIGMLPSSGIVTMNLAGTYTSTRGITAAASYTSASSVTKDIGVRTSSAGTGTLFEYAFSLAKESQLGFTYTPVGLSGTTVSLINAGTGAVTYYSVSTAELFANLTKGSYIFEVFTATPLKNLDGFIVSATVSPVPVPGTLLLFGSGLVGLALVRRRRLGREPQNF